MAGYVIFLLAISVPGCLGQPPGGGGSGSGGGSSPPSWSTTWETTLRTELFTGYEVLQRPSKVVNITVAFNLLAVNELKWTDSRLNWMTPTSGNDYSNVKFLFSSETYVWRPSIVISNSVENMEIISDSKVPMRITNTGKVIWSPFGIYKVTCQSDITYYPLDQQKCTITLSSWAYTTSEVNMYLDGNTMDLNFYTENGEWEIMSTEGKQGGSHSRGGITFSSLEYSITLRRRLLFHVLNTLFPVALMAFLIPMVFKLHVDSGEKVGYALTVLLAYAVYLSMISDSIPSTSVSVCFLAVYLVFILAMGTFSVFCTLLIIDINQKSSEMSPRMRWWIRDVIGRIICEDCKGCCCAKRCCSKAKVGTATSKHSDVIELTPVEEVEEPEYTWQDASYTLDRFFFDLFMLIILLSTIVYATLIFIQYE